jgi:hypothetical protein
MSHLRYAARVTSPSQQTKPFIETNNIWPQLRTTLQIQKLTLPSQRRKGRLAQRQTVTTFLLRMCLDHHGQRHTPRRRFTVITISYVIFTLLHKLTSRLDQIIEGVIDLDPHYQRGIFHLPTCLPLANHFDDRCRLVRNQTNWAHRLRISQFLHPTHHLR